MLHFLSIEIVDENNFALIYLESKRWRKMVSHQLTNLQLELIKLYSTELERNELIELKQELAKFFAKKAVREADAIWDEQKLTNDEMDSWLNE